MPATSDRCRHRAPPSWVVHRARPKAKPSLALAKRSALTADWSPSTTVIVARGAGMPRQLRPPSLVRSIDVQGGVLQGAVPSTQPCELEMNVTLAAMNPLGTGPP